MAQDQEGSGRLHTDVVRFVGWLRKLRKDQEEFWELRKAPEGLVVKWSKSLETPERLVHTISPLFHRCSGIHWITVLFSARQRCPSPPPFANWPEPWDMSMSIQSASCVAGVSAHALSRATSALKSTIARSVPVHSWSVWMCAMTRTETRTRMMTRATRGRSQRFRASLANRQQSNLSVATQFSCSCCCSWGHKNSKMALLGA